MKIGIISTGDELLRGAIADTNAAWMASRFDEIGFKVSRFTVVGDDLNALTTTFEQWFEQFDLIIVGGGLGPTDDDLTAQAAARAAKVPLVRIPEAEKQVRDIFVKLGRTMVEVNLKQAELPQGCRILENHKGTAPGFVVATRRGRVVFLPGVPLEMRPMFERYVLGEMPAPEGSRYRAVFKCLGMGESVIQTVLRPIADEFKELRFAYRVTFPEISVTIESANQETVKQAREKIIPMLGEALYAQEVLSIPEALGRALKARGLKAATAESCTGGFIASSMTDVAGSSAYFYGGIVAYDNSVKISRLGVSEKDIEQHGAVSEEVVKAMAVGAIKTLGVDLAIATSGIAGPDGGTDEKPVGLVHMAVAHPGGVIHNQRIFKNYDRHRVKLASAWTVMKMALDVLEK